MNKEIKRRIMGGERLVGTHLTMGNVWVADIFGQSGVDYVWLDTEHGPMPTDSLADCITVLKAHGTAAFVRTRIDDFNHTKRLLDMGADGIIFPMINTAEQAEKCISFTYYPPRGIRGFGPGKAVDYGRASVADYMANEDMLCRFVQIETPTAIANLEDIASVEGIDGFIIGPCDLSINCGFGADPFAEDAFNTIKDIVARLKALGKYVGISVGGYGAAQLQKWVDIGVDMISAGVDTGFVLDGVTQTKNRLKNQ